MGEFGAVLRDLTIPLLRMHEAYAEELTADLSESQMDDCPGAGHENTPRFTLGHLCVGGALTVWVIENGIYDPSAVVLDVPPIFEELFRRMGPADRRTPEQSDRAPDRDELLTEFRRQHDRLEAAILAAGEERLQKPYPWKLSHFMPRVGDNVVFMATHEAMHLGQLASWRRAMGLPAALAAVVEKFAPPSN